MNIKKLFIWTSIIVGIIALIVITLLVFNSKSSQCNTGDKYDNSTQMCYFTNTSCQPGMTSSPVMVNDTQQYNCLYTPTSIFDNKVFLWSLIIIGVGWFVIFILFIINIASKGDKSVELGEFRAEDFVNVDRVRHLWAMTFARDNNLPMYGDEGYQKSVFNFYKKQQIFQKGDEWFVQFQCEITAGKNPGLYTMIISMSRGEKWILGGNQNWAECDYKDYKLDATRPLHTPKNQQERMLQSLAESNPERAIELQSKMLEEGAGKQPTQQYEQVAPDVMPQNNYGGIPPYRPRQRRPFYRRY